MIVDERTGEVHDYTRRSGVISSHIILPDNHPDWAEDRSHLWSAVELAETRKNSVVAREVEIALPAELNAAEREELAVNFAVHLVDRYGVASEVCIHEPSREGDQRNHHAHILFTTRRMDETGFTNKTRELDDKKTGPEEIETIRKDWQDFQNSALQKSGSEKRVDCRSLAEQRDEALSLAQFHLDPHNAHDPERFSKAESYADLAESLNREPTKHKGPLETIRQRISKRAERLRERFNDLVGRFDALVSMLSLGPNLVMNDGIREGKIAMRDDAATRIKGIMSQDRPKPSNRREERTAAENIKGAISKPDDQSAQVDRQISAAQRLSEIRQKTRSQEGTVARNLTKDRGRDDDLER